MEFFKMLLEWHLPLINMSSEECQNVINCMYLFKEGSDPKEFEFVGENDKFFFENTVLPELETQKL